jgi:hypothetical protein
MNVLRLAAQLVLDGTRFRAGMREAQKVTRDFGRDAVGTLKGEMLGIFGTAALVNFAKESLKAVANMKDLAEQTGMTVSEVQKMEVAAVGLGLSTDEVAMAISRIGVARRQAAEGSEQERERFRKFGITLDDLQDPALRNVDLFTRIGKAIGDMPRTSALEEDMREFLGKTGPKMVDLLKSLSEVKINPISDEAIERIDKADKTLDRIGKRSRNLIAVIAAEGLGMFEKAWDEKNPLHLMDPVTKIMLGVKNAFWPTDKPGGITPKDGEWQGPKQPLFEDKAAKAAAISQQKADAKASQDLQEQLLRFRLATMNPAQQKAQREIEARSQMDRIGWMEDFDAFATRADIDGERSKLARMGAELAGSRGGSSLGVDSLTASGQLGGGRNIVVDNGPDKIVETIKQFLGKPAADTATAVKSIDQKTRPGTTIRGSL